MRPQNEAYKFRANIGGREHTQANAGGLEYLMIEDHVDLVGTARFCFNLDHGSWSSIQVGSDVVVQVGQTNRKMFVGVVTGMRHAFKQGRETMTVTAMDPLIKASASRKTETFEKMTDSDVAQKVIARAGMQPGQVDSTTEKNDYIIQRNESDLEFLKKLAARNNFILMSNEGKIDFKKAQYGGGAVQIGCEMLEDLDYTITATAVPPNITSYGWDYAKAEKVEGSAGSGDIDLIGRGRNAVDVAAAIWKDSSFTSELQVHTQGMAKNVSVGELNRAARNFLKGTARIDGNALIHAGAKAFLNGHPTGFNPEVYVVSSRHIFEYKRGYATEFNFCSNTLPT